MPFPAVGTRIEAPKGVECGGGMSPPDWGKGLGRGLRFLPGNFFLL